MDTQANRITNGAMHWRTRLREPQSAEPRGNVVDPGLSTPVGRNEMFRILIYVQGLGLASCQWLGNLQVSSRDTPA